MRKRISALLPVLLPLFFSYAWGQSGDTIFLTNPSFEDMPRHSKPPRAWEDCGFVGETPPDVQPSGEFGVTRPAYEGKTYLGMVVRDNDTWEAVSQRISRPMRKGQCYEFRLYLARSPMYVSVSRRTDETANYVKPAKVRVYGGFDYCDKQYQLDETVLIENDEWKEYRFKLEPIANYTHLIIEAFYQTPTLFPYNGNVLVDMASALVPIDCDQPVTDAPLPPPVRTEPEEELLTERTPAPPRRPSPPPVRTLDEKPKAPAVQPDTKPAEEEVTIAGLTRAELREGTTIRIDRLYFEADSSMITTTSFEVLDEIYRFLNKNSDVVIEIGGHTNGLPPHDYCDRLSRDRAKAVAEYLVSKGIDRNRLQYKGYGKRDPIADNDTAEGRRLNQRVEIKILGFDG